MLSPTPPADPSPLLSVQVATLNLHKMEEMNGFLKVQTPTPRFQFVMNPEAPEVDEIGESFLDNAQLKARGCELMADSHWVLGDDSGLVIPALSGTQGLEEFPGIYSNRWFREKERQEILGAP
ncbi:MAG: non-canonical purine NTP pyrophosphatase, partial [Cyanobacteria bacterium]|nr:non-canonical purine NTP pyrophosphatase [Cyanobacteriota bacterium]